MQLFIYYISFIFLNILISAKLFIQHRYSKTPKNVAYLYAQNNFLSTNKVIDVTFFENLFILFFFSVKSNNSLFTKYEYTSNFKSLFLKTYKRPLLSYLTFTILNLIESKKKTEENSELTLLTIKKTLRLLKKPTTLKQFAIIKTKNKFTNIVLNLLLLATYVDVVKTKLIFLINLKNTFKKLNNKTKITQYIFNRDFTISLITSSASSLDYSTQTIIFLITQLTNQKFIGSQLPLEPAKQTTYVRNYFFSRYNSAFATTFFKQRVNTRVKQFKITVVTNFFNKLKTLYSIRFNTDITVKFLTPINVQNQKILYLRKNKIFNKSRYSRNRQLYRTGVYWCFWFTIFLGVGIYFVFYRFTVNFGYHWWLTFLALSSFVFNRVVKYRLYNPRLLLSSFVKTAVWFFLITKTIFVNIWSQSTRHLVSVITFIRVSTNKLIYFFKNII